MKKFADKLHIVENETEALSAIEQELATEGVSVVSFLNAHAYTMADASEQFKDNLLKANLLFRDGIGAKKLLQHYNLEPGYNANGTDLIPLILSHFTAKTFCFIGTESPFIDEAANLCRSKGNNVLAYLDGFQNTETMFAFVNEYKPEILILGMGMPRQEEFARYLQLHYDGSLLVVNGGAIFDFLANRFARAPELFRKLNIEWLYRLMNEPKRLFKRYVIGIPKFFLLLRKHSKLEQEKAQ